MWDYIVWFFDELIIFLSDLWDSILGSFASLIEAIPAPDFLLNMGSYSLPTSIQYYASAFEIPAGIAIIVSAYTLRFFIRRIPIIG